MSSKKGNQFLSPLDWVRSAEAPVPAPAAAQAAPQPAAAPAPAPEPTPVEGHAVAPEPKTVPKPRRKQEPAGGMPWDGIEPDAKTSYLARLTKIQHAKLTHIVDNTPRCSIQKLISEGVDLVIAKHLRELTRED